MIFKNEKTQNWYIKDTPVENIFISEHMGVAPGDFVKVYLLAQMYAGIGESVEPRIFANQLMISEAVVEEAWDYWVDNGLARKINRGSHPEDGYDIELISAKEALYCGGGIAPAGGAEEAAAEEESSEAADRLVDEELSQLFAEIQRILGRPLGGHEPVIIQSWLVEYDANVEMILYAYAYCVKTVGKDNVRYIDAVVKEWARLGLTDTEKIDAYLETCEQSRSLQRRVFKALGFRRNATEEEDAMMKRWFTSDGFTIEDVLSACKKTSGISNPNMNYVDKVLQSWRNEGQAGNTPVQAEPVVNQATVKSYYEYLLQHNREVAQAHKTEVCNKMPRIGEIQAKLREVAPQITRCMIKGNKEEAASLKELQAKLREEQTSLLKKLGHPADYMEVNYTCAICKDTGLTETGERCSCYEKRLSEAKEWQKSLRR